LYFRFRFAVLQTFSFFLATLVTPASPMNQAAGHAGTIVGTLTDPSGAVLPSAEVSLTNSVTGYKQSTKTDNTGAFRLSNVPPNQYKLQITASGFQQYEQTVPVYTQVPIQIKAGLALAGSVEQVTVEASDGTLENVPSSHTDVDQNLMDRLPISSAGQGLSDAITLTSGGVVADSNGFFHPQGDHGETSYVVDG
jgi:hypothetical protein